eukprot:TRINITY_DN144_c0_g1_i1.p1 TRINITY_DN144_c0_g1~~TRINITY_DN144_c0_g1_i1.p1  ORF type:complete len:214 (+),score=46.98 TRINITY_DN144_c0_g1_i1:99-644(+)
MYRSVVLAVIVALIAIVSSQDNRYRIDLILEYTGKVDWNNNQFSLTSVSETIQVLLATNGDIHYDVISRLRGPVSHLTGTLNWVTVGKSFTSTINLSFGGSHISQPHVLTATTIEYGYVLPAHHEVIASISQYNITGGQGAYASVSGGITVNGYHTIAGDATWLVNAVFWLPNAPPMEDKE